MNQCTFGGFFQSGIIEDYNRPEDLSPVLSFLLGLLKFKSVIIYGVFEDIIALLNRNEMCSVNETATILSFTRIAILDGGPKIPFVVLQDLCSAIEKNIVNAEKDNLKTAATANHAEEQSNNVLEESTEKKDDDTDLIKYCRDAVNQLQTQIS